MEYTVDNWLTYMPINLSNGTNDALKKGIMGSLMMADWMCGAQDPRVLVSQHLSLLIVEVMFLALASVALAHAVRHGARYVYTFIGVLMFGITFEFLTSYSHELHVRFYAQSLLTFFGKRVPLFVLVALHPFLMYTSIVAAKGLRVRSFAEGIAAGLIGIVLYAPFEIVGVRQLWWTWHDTDPRIGNRLYNVPWAYIYLQFVSIAAFVWILNCARDRLVDKAYDWKLFGRELLCVSLAAIVAPFIAVLSFAPVEFIHLYFHVPYYCACVVALLTITFVFWSFERRALTDIVEDPDYLHNTRVFDIWPMIELLCSFMLYGIVLLSLASLADPEWNVPTSVWQPIGPCEKMEPIHSLAGGAIPLTMTRNTFLCPTRYKESYFDFKCTEHNRPPTMRHGTPVEWYPICGVPHRNYSEHIFVVLMTITFGMALLFEFACMSFGLPHSQVVPSTKKKEE